MPGAKTWCLTIGQLPVTDFLVVASSLQLQTSGATVLPPHLTQIHSEHSSHQIDIVNHLCKILHFPHFAHQEDWSVIAGSTDIDQLLHKTHTRASPEMAEGAGAQEPPTFKLVLVGDGGTGKVRCHQSLLLSPPWGMILFVNSPNRQAQQLISRYRPHS